MEVENESEASKAEVKSQVGELETLLDKKDYRPSDKPTTDTPKEQEKQDDGTLANLVKGGFAAVATRRGEHWILSDPEAETLGELTARVLAKWLPAVGNTPEAALGLALGGMVWSRWQTDQALIAQYQEQKAKEAPNADSGKSQSPK